MTKTIFIGATGTDMGKTYVTCLLLRQLREKGYKARALKPIISGFNPQNIPESDTGKLLMAMGQDPTLTNAKKISPWRYRDPLPPHMAAQQQGCPIDVNQLIAFCRAQAEEDLDYLLIEGVGGMMTPLTDHQTTLDLILALNCPALLVTGSYLGTFSHTLTTITCLRHHNIDLKAVILSESSQSYTTITGIFADFIKFLPHMALKKITRDNQEEDISALLI